MNYQLFYFTCLLLLLWAPAEVPAAKEPTREGKYLFYNPNRIPSPWNRSLIRSESSEKTEWQPDSEQHHQSHNQEGHDELGFGETIYRCVKERRSQITENFDLGKAIILKCFKAAVILNLIPYMTTSSQPNIKLFNGILEVVKVSNSKYNNGTGTESDKENCMYDWSLNTGTNGNSIKDFNKSVYRKAVQNLVNEGIVKSGIDVSEEDQMQRLDSYTNNYLMAILRSLGRRDLEEAEEKQLKRELADPNLLCILNNLSRNYMIKLRVYPGVTVRMQRSINGRVTFDFETEYFSRSLTDDGLLNNESIEEVSDGDSDMSEYAEGRKKGSSSKNGDKNKQIKKKNKQKRQKKKKMKFLKHLLIPFSIQLAILPIILKNLFFLAIKALIAGKIALILIVYNLLRNAKIENEDHRIRVEHYGYKKGEEYGAWINGRSLNYAPSTVDILSEKPFWGHTPLAS